jgi:hypothetical protein
MITAHHLKWATPLEADAIRARLNAPGVSEAAKALGISTASLEQRLVSVVIKAARAGYAPEVNQEHEVPKGYHVKGASTLYDAEGNVKLQWVKSQQDQEDKLQALREALSDMLTEYHGVAEPAPAPAYAMGDLLAVYPLGDAHLGMLSWAKETGVDYDLRIAEEQITDAIDRAVSSAMPAAHALVIDVGDFFHTDDSTNRTARSGNVLDVDSRYAKRASVGLRLKRRIIDRVLRRHAQVSVWNEQGNHDEHTSVMLGLAIKAIYEREPRVSVSINPGLFDFLRHGKCLIASTHGHTVKGAKLPLLMAARNSEAWGATRWRHWYLGHVHHADQQEYPGCTVQYVQALAPKDAWASGAGYDAERGQLVDIWHAERGRIATLYHGVGG